MEVREEHVIRSPFTMEIPDVDLYTFLSANILKLKNKKALIELETQRSLTYADINEMTERIAGFLYHELLIRPRDLVALVSPNCLEYALVVLATLRIGATIVTINAMSSTDELVHYLKSAPPKILITNSARIKDLKQNAISGSMQIIPLDNAEGDLSITTSIQSILQIRTRYVKAPPVESFKIDPRQDLAVVNFSSGTSGLPKAVMNSHRNIMGLICTISHEGAGQTQFPGKSSELPDAWDEVDAASQRSTGHPQVTGLADYFVIYQPLSHIFGFSLTLFAIYRGATAVIIKQFNMDRYLKAVQDFQITRLHMVPSVAIMMSKSGLNRKYNLNHVTSVVVASSPFTESGENELRKFFNNHSLVINQGYGLTETTGLISHGVAEFEGLKKIHPFLKRDPPGTVGYLTPLCEIMIVNVKNWRSEGPRQVGEVWARSPLVMKGYMNNESATRETILQNGWLRTGDLGYYDEDGFLFIVGRLKELIKYKSYQVPPAELEALILTHPGVADAGVIGLPDPVAGELPHAWVVKKSDQQINEIDIIDWVKDRAAAYKWLRGGVKFVDAIPKNPTGKILRRIMLEKSTKSSKL